MKQRSMIRRLVVWMAYVAVIGMIGAPSARADFTAAFNSGQNDFTTNFYLARGSASMFVWQSGGWMRFDNATADRASCIYDTQVPPRGTDQLSVIGGGTQKEVYSIDFLVGHEKESAGISARIQGTGIGTGGYGVWLNVDDGSKAFSLFRLSSAFAGTSLASASLETDLIAVDTWYTLTLT